MNKPVFVNLGATKHFAPQAVEEDAIGVELAVEVVAIPDGNAGLVFEFENEVAPAVQDLNIVAFEGRVGQYHNIIDAVAIGCEHIRDPDVGVGNKDGDERGVDAAEVVGNGECNLLRAALRKTDALVSAAEVPVPGIGPRRRIILNRNGLANAANTWGSDARLKVRNHNCLSLAVHTTRVGISDVQYHLEGSLRVVGYTWRRKLTRGLAIAKIPGLGEISALRRGICEG